MEMFSGKKAITRATQKLDLRATALDKTYSTDPIMDMLTPAGFEHALATVCRVREGGTAWAAPVCSSWVWISRSTSKRTSSNPMGDSSHTFVKEGNILMKHTCAVLLIAWLRGVYVFVEQPCSSLMRLAEPMRSFFILIANIQVRVCLGSYGGSSPKPIYVYSNNQAVLSLKRKLPSKAKWDKLAEITEDGQVNGLSKKLKQSQAYPEKFGEAVAKITEFSFHERVMTKFGIEKFQ